MAVQKKIQISSRTENKNVIESQKIILKPPASISEGKRQYDLVNRSLKAKESQLKDSIMELAYALHSMNISGLYKHAGYHSFRDYIDSELTIGKTMAYKYIKVVMGVERGLLTRSEVEQLGLEKAQAYLNFADNPKAASLKLAMLSEGMSLRTFKNILKNPNSKKLKSKVSGRVQINDVDGMLLLEYFDCSGEQLMQCIANTLVNLGYSVGVQSSSREIDIRLNELDEDGDIN